jgi:RimJ/RimL family protein N-acetyltransferase
MLLDEFWGKGYATEALKAYLDHYWSLERREYVRVVSEGEDDQDNPTSTADEEKEVEVLTAITEAGNVGSINVLRKCGFRETRRFLHENGAWRVDFVMERPSAV